MKILLILIFILFGLGACASKDKNYYNRANMASQKALDGLQKDTE